MWKSRVFEASLAEQSWKSDTVSTRTVCSSAARHLRRRLERAVIQLQSPIGQTTALCSERFRPKLSPILKT